MEAKKGVKAKQVPFVIGFTVATTNFTVFFQRNRWRRTLLNSGVIRYTARFNNAGVFIEQGLDTTGTTFFFRRGQRVLVAEGFVQLPQSIPVAGGSAKKVKVKKAMVKAKKKRV